MKTETQHDGRTWRVRKELPDGMFSSAEFTFETPVGRSSVLNSAQVKRWLGQDTLSEAYTIVSRQSTCVELNEHTRTELKRFLVAAIAAEKWKQVKDLVDFLDIYNVTPNMIPTVYFDPVMSAYRAWLVFGEWNKING